MENIKKVLKPVTALQSYDGVKIIYMVSLPNFTKLNNV